MSHPFRYTVIRCDDDQQPRNKYKPSQKSQNGLQESQDVLRPLGLRLSSPESVHNSIFPPPYKTLSFRPRFSRKSRASLPNICPDRLLSLCGTSVIIFRRYFVCV